jgi:hypothetical protein
MRDFNRLNPGTSMVTVTKKVVDVWLAEMEDYLHAAKVGRHSAVELTQFYLKSCRNFNLGLTGVKAKRSQGCRPRRRSLGVTSHSPGSVRKCEGV